ncbi:MAG TPA: radical SAM family heme chaperone HemW [Chitinophagaceae bacterium]|nr:radical SAM family heme chaperone HemW [Chitinophagaceae bacterium]
MPGIYFHIPFCKQACNYCNFHFSTSLLPRNEMIDSMINELRLTKASDAAGNLEVIDTIYFGGGTPSLLTIAEIKKLLEAVHQYCNVTENAEITLEANPDDINEVKLAECKSIGINRFSIGIQSFKEEDLVWMNRAHNAEQALRSIHLVKDAGYQNYSVDLIYGTPTLSDEDWEKNIQTVIDLSVPHISCYALTVEIKTVLHKLISLKKIEDVDPERQAAQFLLLINWLTDAGYEHYEISNFAKPGYRSKHNSSYWLGESYIGIGPSAHSFNGLSRRWNVSNNALYLQSLQKNVIPFEEEKLTETQRLNEYIMTSIRTIEGIDLDFVKKKFGKNASRRLEATSKKFIEDYKLQAINCKLVLTNEGKLFADGIAADLFFEEEINVFEA